jgi:hypothetical protein
MKGTLVELKEKRTSMSQTRMHGDQDWQHASVTFSAAVRVWYQH